MADSKISDLTAATTIAAADLITIVQGGINKKATGTILSTYTGWNRVDLGAGDYVITPRTATDEIQVPTVNTGQILFADLGGLKKITGDNGLKWNGSGITVSVAFEPFIKMVNSSADAASGLELYNSNDGSSAISHNNEVGNSILNIDALTGTGGVSTIRFGYKTTASDINYQFWTGKATYSSHPTFTTDVDIIDKKYADDAISTANLWDRIGLGGGVFVITPKTATDFIQVPTAGPASGGNIFFSSLAGHKTIATTNSLLWTGSGVIVGSSSPYIKASASAGAPQSGTVIGATSDALGYLYHLSHVGNATLDIDAIPKDATFTSVFRYGFNCAASLSRTHSFYGEVVANSSITGTMLYSTKEGIGGDNLELLRLTNSVAIRTSIETSVSQSLYLKSRDGTSLPAADIRAYTVSGWNETSSGQEFSGLRFSITQMGTLTTALTLTHGVLTAPNYIVGQQLFATRSGTVKNTSTFLTLTNTVNAVDMDKTGTALVFAQTAYHATTPVTYDSAGIYSVTDTDWTTTASTRDSSMVFQVAKAGELITKLKLSPTRVYISAYTTDSNEFVFSNYSSTVEFMINCTGSNNFQSILRFSKLSTTMWTFASRHEIDTPNDRLSLYYSAATQVMYYYPGRFAPITCSYDADPSTTHLAADEMWTVYMDSSHALKFAFRTGGAVTVKTVTIT